jgi:hypothetical protein
MSGNVGKGKSSMTTSARFTGSSTAARHSPESDTRELVPTEGAERPLGPVDQDRIERLAGRINAIYREATLDVTYSIGELVIKELYEGQLGLWGSHGTRRASYRRLAARGDLLLSPSALCRAVAIYVLCQRSGGKGSYRHLTASHLQEVLALEAPQQEHLLRAAEAEHWTVSRLRAEVQKRRPNASRSKRPPLVRALAKMRTLLDDNCGILNDADSLRAMSNEATRECRATLAEVSARLDALSRALEET